MSYTVLVCPRAQRQMRGLAKRDQDRLREHMTALARDPRPSGAVAMREIRRTYRIRVGDFRIVYAVNERTIAVLVLEVAHRREAYRGSDIDAMDRDARVWLADQDQRRTEPTDDGTS